MPWPLAVDADRNVSAAAGRAAAVAGLINLTGPRSYFKASGNPFVPELVAKLKEGLQETMDYVKTDEYKAVLARQAYVRRGHPGLWAMTAYADEGGLHGCVALRLTGSLRQLARPRPRRARNSAGRPQRCTASMTLYSVFGTGGAGAMLAGRHQLWRSGLRWPRRGGSLCARGLQARQPKTGAEG